MKSKENKRVMLNPKILLQVSDETLRKLNIKPKYENKK